MGALLTGAGVAACALVLAILLRKNSAWPKVVPWLMLTAGFGLAGLAGALLTRLVGMILGVVGAGTNALFGAAVPGIVALGIGVALFIHMRPKASPSKATPWLALIFPAVLVAMGGPFANLGTGFGDMVLTIWQTGLSLFGDAAGSI